MPYTEAQLIVEIRSLLNEDTAAFYTDAMLTQWLRQGVRDIALKTRCVEGDTSVTVSAGVLRYPLPTDCFVILACLRENGDALIRIDPQKAGMQGDSEDAADGPRFYWLHNGFLYVKPRLLADTQDLLVLYARTTENVTEIPDAYRFTLIDYALGRALLRNSQPIEALASLNAFHAEELFNRNDIFEAGRMSAAMDDVTLPDSKVQANQ